MAGQWERLQRSPEPHRPAFPDKGPCKHARLICGTEGSLTAGNPRRFQAFMGRHVYESTRHSADIPLFPRRSSAELLFFGAVSDVRSAQCAQYSSAGGPVTTEGHAVWEARGKTPGAGQVAILQLEYQTHSSISATMEEAIFTA